MRASNAAMRTDRATRPPVAVVDPIEEQMRFCASPHFWGDLCIKFQRGELQLMERTVKYGRRDPRRCDFDRADLLDRLTSEIAEFRQRHSYGSVRVQFEGGIVTDFEVAMTIKPQ